MIDIKERINELYQQRSNENEFWVKIAKTITEETGEEYSRDRVRGLWRRSKPASDEQIYITVDESIKVKVPDTIEMEDDTFLGETLDEFIKRKDIDLGVFSIVEATVNEYAGNEQIKLRLKPKVDEPFNQEEFLARIADVVDRPRIIPDFVDDGGEESDYLFIPVLFDAHIDSPKFNGNYINWLESLLKMGKKAGYRPGRILFVVGNDFGHIDNGRYETTAGTLVGSTRTYLDSVDERCSILLNACNLLRRHCPKVDVVFVPGNHDAFSVYWLGKVIESYYKSDGGVTVLNGQSPRKYYRYGKTLFGLTHGNEEKKYDLASLMAVESPLDWAASENRVWLMGHLHQQNRQYGMLSEQFGVIQRIFSSLVAPDDWHVLKGYVGNAQTAELLVYDTDGKIGEFQLAIR